MKESDYDPTKHNYYKKVLALGLTLTPGSAFDVDVIHDDWCAINQDEYCNCDPIIKFRDHN